MRASTCVPNEARWAEVPPHAKGESCCRIATPPLDTFIEQATWIVTRYARLPGPCLSVSEDGAEVGREGRREWGEGGREGGKGGRRQ